MDQMKGAPSGRCVEITVPLARGNSAPFATEVLWAWPRRDGRFRLESTPLFAPDLHRRDLVVAVAAGDNGLEFLALAETAGHATLLVDIHRPRAGAVVLAELERLGCRLDSAQETALVAVDLAPAVSEDEVCTVLDRAAARAILTWWPKGEPAPDLDSCRAGTCFEIGSDLAEFVYLTHGRICHRWPRILYGEELDAICPDCASQMEPCGPCPCCRVRAGMLHQAGCCQEQCPACGEALQTCPCPIEAFGSDDESGR